MWRSVSPPNASIRRGPSLLPTHESTQRRGGGKGPAGLLTGVIVCTLPPFLIAPQGRRVRFEQIDSRGVDMYRQSTAAQRAYRTTISSRAVAWIFSFADVTIDGDRPWDIRVVDDRFFW